VAPTDRTPTDRAPVDTAQSDRAPAGSDGGPDRLGADPQARH
jgi:hypothetical protein